MKIKRLLIIPGRKNSKRIKNKNFVNFFGKPIIFYSIELGIKSKLFEKIHVTTDNKKYGMKIKKNYKVDVDFNRPSYLSNDKVGLAKVLKYVIFNYSKKNLLFDEIWYLSSCSPLIKKNDLLKSSKMFRLSSAQLMLSVCKYSQPIERSFVKIRGKINPISPKHMKLNTQNINKKFFHTGSFAAFKKNYFNKKKFKNSIFGYELPIWKSVDVDNYDDLKMTKILFTGRLK